MERFDVSNEPTTIRLFGTATDSIVDGPGLRYSIFTQGCLHHCPGCHNQESQRRDGGYMAQIDDLIAEIAANPLMQGVTLTGGDPLMQSEACVVVARRIKEELGLNIWLYSGYLYEDIRAGNCGKAAVDLLGYCDVLVDGPFIEKLFHYDILWRGSSNQRLIHLPLSLEKGEVVLWESKETFPEPPPSW